MKTKDSRLALEAACQKAAEDLCAAIAAAYDADSTDADSTDAYDDVAVAADAYVKAADATYSKARAALEAYLAKQSAALDANLVKLK